jgi:hypothetical protein
MESVAYDQSCIRLPDVVHVFSSGNEGDKASPDGDYAGLAGWANITGQFKQSKNTITVGATDSLDHVVALSSRGPAFDGRIKPEVVAYGHGGTSGAAAMVSGLCILIQEAFKHTHAETLPSSSLVKAVLINTALDVGISGPDFESGFGSVRAYKAIKTIEEDRIITDQVIKGADNVYPMTIPNGISRLNMTIAWNDPAASLNAPDALINDLDFEIKKITSCETWRPWILNAF